MYCFVYNQKECSKYSNVELARHTHIYIFVHKFNYYYRFVVQSFVILLEHLHPPPLLFKKNRFFFLLVYILLLGWVKLRLGVPCRVRLWVWWKICREEMKRQTKTGSPCVHRWKYMACVEVHGPGAKLRNTRTTKQLRQQS